MLKQNNPESLALIRYIKTCQNLISGSKYCPAHSRQFLDRYLRHFFLYTRRCVTQLYFKIITPVITFQLHYLCPQLILKLPIINQCWLYRYLHVGSNRLQKGSSIQVQEQVVIGFGVKLHLRIVIHVMSWVEGYGFGKFKASINYFDQDGLQYFCLRCSCRYTKCRRPEICIFHY